MYTILKQRRMRWRGHLVRMDDGRMPKDLLFGELTQGTRPKGRPQLRYKDVCKRDLQALRVGLKTWEALASERSSWRLAVQEGLTKYEETLVQRSTARSQRRKTRHHMGRSSNRAHLHTVQERLPLPNRPYQSYKSMRQSANSIVSRDGRKLTTMPPEGVDFPHLTGHG